MRYSFALCHTKARPCDLSGPGAPTLPSCLVHRSLCHAFEPGDRCLGRDLESGARITIDW